MDIELRPVQPELNQGSGLRQDLQAPRRVELEVGPQLQQNPFRLCQCTGSESPVVFERPSASRLRS